MQMIVKDKSRQEIMKSTLKLLVYRQETYNRYYVKFSADDQKGKSILEGIIVFPGNRIAIKLAKLYENT